MERIAARETMERWATVRTYRLELASAVIASAEPAAAPTEPEHETTIRSIPDRHAAAIGACIGSRPAAVQVAYAESGTLTVSLTGDASGAPQEGYVRALLRSETVAAPGRPGVVVHVVQ